MTMTTSRLVVLVGVICFILGAVSVREVILLVPEQWALLGLGCWLGSTLV